MEPDEICLVLSRAAELHANISAAIQRSINSDLRLTSTDEHHCVAEMVAVAQDHHPLSGAAEAQSLASIRDALEVLEEQLECLKTLQQQQRVEKDATLAELEESREILLRRLKKHHGREWEVIKEAFLFAGEPMQEKDGLQLPPYTMPRAADASLFTDFDHQTSSFSASSSCQQDATSRHLVFVDGQADSDQEMFSVMDEDNERRDVSEEGEGSMYEDDAQKSCRGLFGGLRSRILKFFSGRLAKASAKAVLLIAGAAAILKLSDAAYVRQTRRGSGRRDTFLGPDMSTELWLKPQRGICPPGKWSIAQDGVQTCVIKERTEMPFEEDIHSPDVSYGLG